MMDYSKYQIETGNNTDTIKIVSTFAAGLFNVPNGQTNYIPHYICYMCDSTKSAHSQLHADDGGHLVYMDIDRVMRLVVWSPRAYTIKQLATAKDYIICVYMFCFVFFVVESQFFFWANCVDQSAARYWRCRGHRVRFAITAFVQLK